MKHVKVATRGMDDIDLGDSPGAGITHEDDDTEGMLVTSIWIQVQMYIC